jgi:hypothetical protein
MTHLRLDKTPNLGVHQTGSSSYVVSLQTDDHTLTETDVQLFANKESAEA